MKALSFSRPWAWVIARGWKDIENREWPLPQKIVAQLPIRIYIHAAKSIDPDALPFIFKRLTMKQKGEYIVTWTETTGIIGEVTITGCVNQSASLWFFGPYGFILQDAILYDKPIPYKGMPKFFEVKL